MTRCREIKELGDLRAGVGSMGLQLMALTLSFGSISGFSFFKSSCYCPWSLVCFECSTATLYI
jgi:hypothetical protein